jgi:hypothetical protein
MDLISWAHPPRLLLHIAQCALVKGMDPDPDPDLDPSNIKQKIVRKTLISPVL